MMRVGKYSRNKICKQQHTAGSERCSGGRLGGKTEEGQESKKRVRVWEAGIE